jgi:membrane protein required for colicin V production
MNFLDIVIIVPLIWAGWKGFKKGLIIEVATMLALGLGIWGGINFSDLIAGLIADGLGSKSKYLPIIAFSITFLLIGAMVYFLGVMLERVVNMVALKLVNKIFGAVFGVAKLALFLSVVIVIMEAYDEKGDFIPEDVKEGSLLYHPTKELSLTLIPALRYSDIFIQASKHVMNDPEFKTVPPIQNNGVDSTAVSSP